MDMTEKLDYLMVKVIGEAGEREVVKDYRPALNDKDFLKVNAVKPSKHRTVPEHSLRVVVAENEVDMTVKSPGFKTPVPLLNIAKAEVSEVVHMVIKPHYGIPIGYESVIHFLNCPKGSVAVLEYVRMEKMS